MTTPSAAKPRASPAGGSPSSRGEGAELVAREPPAIRTSVWVVRMLVGWAALFGAVAAAAYFFRAPIESMGQTFVGRFGLAGMALGTFMADSIQFPPPVQFYLLATITGSASPVWPLVVICIASVAGGHAGYFGGQRLSRIPWFSARFSRVPPQVANLVRRRALTSLLLISASPLPYPLLCWIIGAYQVRYRLFSFFWLLRIPRIFVFYAFIRAGWALSG